MHGLSSIWFQHPFFLPVVVTAKTNVVRPLLTVGGRVLLEALPLLFAALVLLSARSRLAVERRLARTDSLTGLLNRFGFFEAAERRRAGVSTKSRASGLAATTLPATRPLTVAFIDLDNFKAVNDTFGHATGSYALALVGKIVASQFRSGDLASRLGGDEFAIAIYGVAAEEAEQRIEHLRQLLDEEMTKHGWPVTFSIGVVTFLVPVPLGIALGEADRLMYTVKRRGKNSLHHEVYRQTAPARLGCSSPA